MTVFPFFWPVSVQVFYVCSNFCCCCHCFSIQR